MTKYGTGTMSADRERGYLRQNHRRRDAHDGNQATAPRNLGNHSRLASPYSPVVPRYMS